MIMFNNYRAKRLATWCRPTSAVVDVVVDVVDVVVVGRSHAAEYALFRAGRPASEGFREFAESGRSDSLDAQSQGEGGIFDEFNAPAVTHGSGRTEAEFFVDSNHSRVSPSLAPSSGGKIVSQPQCLDAVRCGRYMQMSVR